MRNERWLQALVFVETRKLAPVRPQAGRGFSLRRRFQLLQRRYGAGRKLPLRSRKKLKGL